MTGRAATVITRRLIGYGAQGQPLYRAEAVDDHNASLTLYGDGVHWTPARPEVVKEPPVRPWRKE